MPGTESQGSFLNRISIRRNQVATSIDNNDQDQEDYEVFLKQVSDRFSALLPTVESPNAAHDPPPLLTIAWFHHLLDVFLCCEAEFKAILLFGRDPSQFSRPPLDRIVPDLLEKSVKALDVLNAVTNGLDLVHHWQKLGQIAVSSLRQSPLGEGQVRRARKALTSLLASMTFDDKENSNSSHGKWTERTRSFGRRIGGSVANKDRSVGSLRSLSWSVAKSWSAAKQVQVMLSNLTAPRGAEAAGPALPIYIMNTILVFVVWTLVAAVPCQERNGLTTHFQIPKNSSWAQPILVLQERIGEEWKKKEKKGTPGLLEELQRMEKVAHSLVEFADSFVFPLEDQRAAEMAAQVEELEEICRTMEEGVVPLQQQVRDVFHRIVKSRGEVLDVLDHVNKLSAAVQY